MAKKMMYLGKEISKHGSGRCHYERLTQQLPGEWRRPGRFHAFAAYSPCKGPVRKQSARALAFEDRVSVLRGRNTLQRCMRARSTAASAQSFGRGRYPKEGYRLDRSFAPRRDLTYTDDSLEWLGQNKA